MLSNSAQLDRKLNASNAWKIFRVSWLVLNGLFFIYLILSFTGLFGAFFPHLFTLIDSEIFLRAVAIASTLLTILALIFRRRLTILLNKIVTNYKIIVTSTESVNAHWVFDGRNGFDLLLSLTAFVVGSLLVYFALTDGEYYLFLIQEDGIVETTSALLWYASMIFIIVSIGLGFRRGISIWFYILLALFFFTCGGEEISWGQRLYKIETPELLSKINVQNEITLHNIGSTSLFSNAFFLITITFFLLIPWLQKHIPGFIIYLTHFGLPGVMRGAVIVYLISLVAWIIVGLRYGTLGFHPFTLWGYYLQLDDELFEMMAALSFFSFAALNALNIEGNLRSK